MRESVSVFVWLRLVTDSVKLKFWFWFRSLLTSFNTMDHLLNLSPKIIDYQPKFDKHVKTVI